MVKLKRLKIDKYRNVRPGTELHFDDGVNLILGQNGAGKTTLLGLLTVVTSNDFSLLKGEAFSIDYTLANETHSAAIHVESAGHVPEDDSDVDRNGASREVDYRYRVVLSDRVGADLVQVVGMPHEIVFITSGMPRETHPAASPFRAAFLLNALAHVNDEALFAAVEAVYALDVSAAHRFDEALDCFYAMTGRAPLISAAGTPLPARLTFRQSRKLKPSVRYSRFTPWRLASLIPDAHASPGGEIRLRIDEHAETNEREIPNELAFLASAARGMGARAAGFKPEIRSIQDLQSGSSVFELDGFSFTFTRSDGRTIHHDLLSYGQKRLLAYFYYLACTPCYVIADELVNGLHHRWIGTCMQAIGSRQAFLTSQNPLLFEHVKFESVEQVERCFITCRTEIVDATEQLAWQNMPRPDAVSFFESYEADIESVGDILITRGLW